MKSESLGSGTLENWNAAEVKKAFDDGKIVLVDVRTPQEYMLENITGALLMPMSGFDPSKLPNDGEKPVVLFCGSSKRSEKLAKRLLEHGCSTARHMEGGFASWKKEELPYRALDLPTGEMEMKNQ